MKFYSLIMIRVANSPGPPTGGEQKDLPPLSHGVAQPRCTAFYVASLLDCQLELCILSQEAPHKTMGRKEVAMFTDFLFLFSCSLKEFSNT